MHDGLRRRVGCAGCTSPRGPAVPDAPIGQGCNKTDDTLDTIRSPASRDIFILTRPQVQMPKQPCLTTAATTATAARRLRALKYDLPFYFIFQTKADSEQNYYGELRPL